MPNPEGFVTMAVSKDVRKQLRRIKIQLEEQYDRRVTFNDILVMLLAKYQNDQRVQQFREEGYN